MTICLLIPNNIARRGNSDPLASTHYGNNQQREATHDGRKTAKREQETILLNPLRNEESPRKRDHTPENADHDEAITRQLIVRVDELE